MVQEKSADVYFNWQSNFIKASQAKPSQGLQKKDKKELKREIIIIN